MGSKRASMLAANTDMNGQESEIPLIQTDNVLNILEEAIAKLKISLILPQLFENPITLQQCFSGSIYEQCTKLMEDYLKTKATDKSIPPHLNYKLIHLIDILQENHQIIELLPDWLGDLDDDDKTLLEAFCVLHKITQQRLQKSAASELDKEKRMHHIYQENEYLKKEIGEFQQKLRNESISMRWKIAAKDSIIRKYSENLAFRKWDNNVRIKQEIAKASRRIQTIHTSSIARQRELEEELIKTQQAYEIILKENLIKERDVRDEKNKLLIQLQSLIKKYDQHIGERMKENMELQEEYVKQKEEFDEFMIEYKREELDYERTVIQKNEEERRQHEEKVMLFMLNHAARVIQKYWKLYRRAKRKNTKKGKGGKGKRK